MNKKEMESKDEKLKILIVYDDKKQLFALESLISTLDLEIYKASSGQEALTLLLHHNFILVLLDMLMPGMSGMEVAHFMRNNKSTQNIPIIFTTAFNKNEVDIISANKLGGIYYIVKPVNEENLLSKIKVFQNFHLFEKKKEEETLHFLSELKEKNKRLEDARIAALNMLEDANEARDEAKVSETKLQKSLEKQKETEKELKIAVKKAEQANKYKDDFLANMSHEIRTPMSGIVGFADLLKNKNLTQKERDQYIHIINTNSERLLRLIDNILDVAKIEAKEMKIVPTECDLNELLREEELLFNQIKKEQNKTDIHFVLDIPEESPFYIEVDSFHLNEVITNLLNNALKFSTKGDITFGYQVKNDNLLFFVQDKGIGIIKEMQDKIFERFQQALPPNAAQYRGTGLGLSICRGLVQLMGGEISVKSEENKGSRFEFTIPLKIIEANKRRKTEENNESIEKKNMGGKTILIADDNTVIQRFFLAALKSLNLNIIMASDGNELVSLFKDHPEIKVILMDIRMPGIDGYEAIKQILKINPQAVIIAQTAHALTEDKQRCLAAGCKDFISKPIRQDKLIEILNKWI